MEDFEQAKDKVMLGAERKSLVLTEKERKLTAYHEAGHAVIGLRYPGLDPVHKVTIVPRGRAMGITASLPEEDRHSYTKEWLEGQLTMLFGGRVAEELVFGLERVTTGAGNDIERATSMARRMVTRFGMSDMIGLMAVGDSEQEVFLGRELVQRHQVSEHTAQQVDQEVKRLLDEAHGRARVVVEENRDLLDSIAEALLERETLDRGEIEGLARGEPLPPLEGVPARIEVDGKGTGPGSGESIENVDSERGEGSGFDRAGASYGSAGQRGRDEEAEEETPSGVSRFGAAGSPPPEGDVSP